jgi:hypothetical protein
MVKGKPRQRTRPQMSGSGEHMLLNFNNKSNQLLDFISFSYPIKSHSMVLFAIHDFGVDSFWIRQCSVFLCIMFREL